MIKFNIVKRTFEALKYPKGSEERKLLNISAVTSEYMTSYKYVAITDGFSKSCKTKSDAEQFALKMTGGNKCM